MPFEGRELLERILSQLNGDEKQSPAIPKEKQFSLIEEAKRDWQAARNYFNAVTDPDLIDHAIYAMEAAEKRYVYLLRRAREDGLFQERFLV